MTYHPGRDHRFDVAEDALIHVEEVFCSKGCKFAINATPEQPSGECELMLKVLLEEPVPEWDDLGNLGLVCNKREAP